MMAVESPPSGKRVKNTKESNQNFQAQGLYRSIGACGAVQAWKSQPFNFPSSRHFYKFCLTGLSNL
jgi:hypothetical protein